MTLAERQATENIRELQDMARNRWDDITELRKEIQALKKRIVECERQHGIYTPERPHR